MIPFVRRHSKDLCLFGSLLLLVVVGAIDVRTGSQASLSVFYSLPIVFAGWFCERQIPFLIAALACVVWCWVDLASGHEYFSRSLQAWEISVRCAFFFAAAIATVAIKDRQAESDARVALLQHARKLEHQITEITEYEQQRIGRELHDGLSQYLAAVSCAMTSLKMDTEKAGSPALAAKAAEIEKLLSESVNQTRDLARSLAPVHHSGPGLAAALDELSAATSRRLGIDCTFETSGEEAIKEDGTATYLYRIAQEAVDNAVKHGKASEITVRLSANPNAVSLSVSDDGVGFSKTQKNSTGIGLSVMEYRAEFIGGELSIEERSNGGTTVSCVIQTERTNHNSWKHVI